MVRYRSAVFFAAALLSATLPVLQAQVIVEAPGKESNVKWFEFPGGTPAQLMEQVKQTFGPFGAAVVMEDLTGGEPLPPVKMFAASAHDFLVNAFPGRSASSGNNDIWSYKFKSSKNPDPFASQDAGSVPARPATVLCQFPGGTPRELVKALDLKFGCRMEEVTTIAPEMENIRLPALNMRVAGAAAFIEKLNDFSRNCAWTYGCWQLTGRDGDRAKPGAELEALMVSPLYSDLNPPPAILARDTAAGPAATAVRALEAKAKTMDATLQQTRQALDSLQQKVSQLPAKAP